MALTACKLEFYVPAADAAAVKAALFAAGAGTLGNYGECCWECPGSGQFRPLAGSDPYIGSAGELERVEELKVEMLLAPELADRAIAALLAAHPYETPAFQLFDVRIG